MKNPNQSDLPSKTVVYSAAAQAGPLAVVRDLAEGWRMHEVWRAFAWDEIQNRYRRSAVGILWILISFVFFVGGIAVFFGGFSSKGGIAFTAHVALGFTLFQFMIGNVTDGCGVFRQAATWIKSSTLPYSIYVYKSVFRSLFPFFIHLAATIIGMAAFGLLRPEWTSLTAVLALGVILLNAVPAQMLLGTIAARYRDITHLISSIMRILFFSTPILWVREEQSGIRAQLADINPFTHYIEIFRAPLLGDAARMESWTIVIGLTIVLWATALTASALMRRRIPFWI